MDQTRKIMIFAVVIASALIIWWVGIYPEPPEVEQEVVSSEEQPPVTTDEDVVAERTSEAIGQGRGGRGQMPFDPNQMAAGFADAGGRGGMTGRGTTNRGDMTTGGRGFGTRQTAQQIDPNEVSDPNDPMVSVAITNLRLNQIIDTLMEWTGKSVIPSDEAANLVVTVYSARRLPRSEALSLLYDAMFMKNFVARETEKVIYIVPASEVVGTYDIPLLDVDDILALYPNKEDVVQKFFRLKNYSPSVMANILTPMLGDSGYSIANDETGSLAIIDTVKRLIGYERVIQQYDSEVTAGIESQTFELKYRVAAEVVEFLEQVLSGTGSSITSNQNMQRGDNRDRGGRNNDNFSVNAATIEAGGSSLVLITEPINNWIIAKASSEYMDIIESWIDKIDIEAPLIEEGTSLVSIDNIQQMAQMAFHLEHYSPSEMAELVEPMVSEDDGWITAEERTGTLVVKDRIINLIDIEKYIEMFDVPEASPNVIRTFTINSVDVTELAQLIELILTGEGVAISTSGRTTTRSR